MKVYVITKGEYSDYHICAVTLDEKNAETIRKFFSGDDEDERAEIESYETDIYTPIIEDKSFFRIWFEKNGEILVEKQEEIFTDSLNKFMKWGHTIFIDIFAYNDEQAKKIALDKYAEYKYRKVNNEL